LDQNFWQKSHNHYRTTSNDGFIHNTCSCHGEIAVIRKAYYRLNLNQKGNLPWIKGNFNKKPIKMFKKMTIYSMRSGLSGEPRNSAPCKDCFNTISSLGIKRVVYFEDGNLVAEKIQNYQTNYLTACKRNIL
tara:strand:+ start:737 stop:1132 length:396 start_codon:yes stop_codon:yes gene_type:complete